MKTPTTPEEFKICKESIRKIGSSVSLTEEYQTKVFTTFIEDSSSSDNTYKVGIIFPIYSDNSNLIKPDKLDENQITVFTEGVLADKVTLTYFKPKEVRTNDVNPNPMALSFTLSYILNNTPVETDKFTYHLIEFYYPIIKNVKGIETNAISFNRIEIKSGVESVFVETIRGTVTTPQAPRDDSTKPMK